MVWGPAYQSGGHGFEYRQAHGFLVLSLFFPIKLSHTMILSVPTCHLRMWKLERFKPSYAVWGKTSLKSTYWVKPTRVLFCNALRSNTCLCKSPLELENISSIKWLMRWSHRPDSEAPGFEGKVELAVDRGKPDEEGLTHLRGQVDLIGQRHL